MCSSIEWANAYRLHKGVIKADMSTCGQSLAGVEEKAPPISPPAKIDCQRETRSSRSLEEFAGSVLEVCTKNLREMLKHN
ncbi:hypothetical protein E2C01_058647 [Portunus trituberculatus]|uniref:Uncharacterized protein n=1 Tax=Portunus trituberculatus TaxID=210409 RepID=A0A5B7H3L1_PORTR|nr:hypothetical protein [Portunus trituberculatus]